MCGDCAPRGGWTRRHVLTAGGITGLTLALPGAIPAATAAPVRPGAQPVEILPRSAWAGADRPPGPLLPEPDVRILVVHHTVNANDYSPESVVPLLQAIHRFHTGPDKGWSDVAYNFLVDRHGRIWEGRAGSIDGPVVGDATGGNQGFDQKCAFLGDHRTEVPSDAAQAAMIGLLAMLADRHGIDTRAGAAATFTSRGSNRHPAGAQVTSATITGHRTMSQTACPGDAGMALVTDVVPAAVTTAREAPAPSPTGSPTTGPPAAPTTGPPAPAPTSVAPASEPTTTSTVPTTAGRATVDPSEVPLAGAPTSPPGAAIAIDDLTLPAGVAAVAAAVTGLIALRTRRQRR